MNSKAKFSIRYKIMAGYLVIILFLLVSFIMLNNEISNLQKSRNFIIDHDFKVLNLTNQVEKDLLTIENKAKGFIISNNQITYNLLILRKRITKSIIKIFSHY